MWVDQVVAPTLGRFLNTDESWTASLPGNGGRQKFVYDANNVEHHEQLLPALVPNRYTI